MFRKKTQTIMGVTAPSPRMTSHWYKMVLLYAAAPVMTLLVGVDVILYFVLRATFDICYGLWCWL